MGTISCGMVAPASIASNSAEFTTLARSSKLGISVQVKTDSSGNWCAESSSVIQIKSDTEKAISQDNLKALLPKLGGIFSKECKELKTAKVVATKNNGEVVYSGTSGPSASWLFSISDKNSSSGVGNSKENNVAQTKTAGKSLEERTKSFYLDLNLHPEKNEGLLVLNDDLSNLVYQKDYSSKAETFKVPSNLKTALEIEEYFHSQIKNRSVEDFSKMVRIEESTPHILEFIYGKNAENIYNSKFKGISELVKNPKNLNEDSKVLDYIKRNVLKYSKMDKTTKLNGYGSSDWYTYDYFKSHPAAEEIIELDNTKNSFKAKKLNKVIVEKVKNLANQMSNYEIKDFGLTYQAQPIYFHVDHEKNPGYNFEENYKNLDKLRSPAAWGKTYMMIPGRYKNKIQEIGPLPSPGLERRWETLDEKYIAGSMQAELTNTFYGLFPFVDEEVASAALQLEKSINNDAEYLRLVDREKELSKNELAWTQYRLKEGPAAQNYFMSQSIKVEPTVKTNDSVNYIYVLPKNIANRFRPEGLSFYFTEETVDQAEIYEDLLNKGVIRLVPYVEFHEIKFDESSLQYTKLYDQLQGYGRKTEIIFRVNKVLIQHAKDINSTDWATIETIYADEYNNEKYNVTLKPSMRKDLPTTYFATAIENSEAYIGNLKKLKSGIIHAGNDLIVQYIDGSKPILRLYKRSGGKQAEYWIDIDESRKIGLDLIKSDFDAPKRLVVAEDKRYSNSFELHEVSESGVVESSVWQTFAVFDEDANLNWPRMK